MKTSFVVVGLMTIVTIIAITVVLVMTSGCAPNGLSPDLESPAPAAVAIPEGRFECHCAGCEPAACDECLCPRVGPCDCGHGCCEASGPTAVIPAPAPAVESPPVARSKIDGPDWDEQARLQKKAKVDSGCACPRCPVWNCVDCLCRPGAGKCECVHARTYAAPPVYFRPGFKAPKKSCN